MHPNALALVASTFAAILQPPAPLAPSEWARENLIVPDGPRANERWNADLTPYILEPLDLLGPESGVNEIAVMKSAQTGFTTLALAFAGFVIDRAPCRIGIVQPTDSALSDFNREKLQPVVDQTAALARKVRPQVSRSGAGSTTYSKAFPGGSLALMIASSAADLRSKTLMVMIYDEIDQYPDDLDGQGDPIDIGNERQTSFLASGDWRRAYISTPTVKGASKIEQRYEAGDRRRFHVTCPHCRADDGGPSEFTFEYGPNFQFSQEWPHNPHYVAPCCGAIIEPQERNALVRAGRWIATAPGPGKYPSYHFDALSSPFVPWLEIARKAVDAGADPRKLKAFTNLVLGLPYEEKGDAPDTANLMERRSPEWRRGHIPPNGLLLTAAADVQMRGIWVEILAVAPDRQTWVVDALYCDGDTASPDGEAFAALKRDVLDRVYPDAFGRERRIDALGIDSGYRSHVVYSFVRQNQRLHEETGRDVLLALKGVEGWSVPAIGTPKLVDIDLDGHRVKKGAKVWKVGTWPLKGAFYAELSKKGLSAGAAADPAGYCHFGSWLDTGYFEQITAEYLAEETYRGRARRIWKARAKDNHFLDCRTYNMALAEYLGLSSTTPEQWAALIKRRGAPPDAAERTLFTAAAQAEAQPTVETRRPPADDWLGDRGQNW